MDRTFTWIVDLKQEGLTLEQFLRTRGCSHHVLTHLKRTECGILLNGDQAYASRRLRAGDAVRLLITEEAPSKSIAPVQMPLNILYEDEDLMIINKPADTPVHPSVNNHENTLANGIMYYFTSRNIPFVFRCINRLDRDTSGLLIIAKNMFSGSVLSSMSARRQVKREYLAIVEGILPESGTIDAPIARMEGSALMRCVNRDRGETAVTHFRRLSYISPAEGGCFTNAKPSALPKSGCSLASILLETGRTHQIRVHMKYIGHPLLGDFLYNPGSDEFIGRQALHSHTLRFQHPVTGEEMEFSSQPPEDMLRIFPPS